MKKFKRGFADIETCPNIVSSWRVGYGINLTPDNIIEERRIICASWKWEGEKKVHNITWDRDQDDERVILAIIAFLDEADEVVFHNGDRFDLPWIKTRAIFHQVPMHPTYRTFDTLKKAKAHLYSNSNRLNYLQKYYGGKGKLDTEGYSLWKKVHLENDRKALQHMVKYCNEDVKELEEFYHTISPYVPHNTHAGAHVGYDKWTCIECGGKRVRAKRHYTTAAGTLKHQMVCPQKTKHRSKMDRYYTVSNRAYQDFQKEVLKIGNVKNGNTTKKRKKR